MFVQTLFAPPLMPSPIEPIISEPTASQSVVMTASFTMPNTPGIMPISVPIPEIMPAAIAEITCTPVWTIIGRLLIKPCASMAMIWTAPERSAGSAAPSPWTRVTMIWPAIIRICGRALINPWTNPWIDWTAPCAIAGRFCAIPCTSPKRSRMPASRIMGSACRMPEANPPTAETAPLIRRGAVCATPLTRAVRICAPPITREGARAPIVCRRFATSCAPCAKSAGIREAMPAAKLEITCGPCSLTMARSPSICVPNRDCKSPRATSRAPISAAGINALRAMLIIDCRPPASFPPTLKIAPPTLPTAEPTLPAKAETLPTIFPRRESPAKLFQAFPPACAIVEARPAAFPPIAVNTPPARFTSPGGRKLRTAARAFPIAAGTVTGSICTACPNVLTPETPAAHALLSSTVLTRFAAARAAAAAPACLNPSGSFSRLPRTASIAPVIPPARSPFANASPNCEAISVAN